MREGRCHGGPLDGQVAVSRYPTGFLLGDKPTGRAWIYDWRDDGFQVREPDPRDFDPQRAIDAALSAEYDVIALPGEGGGTDGR